MPNLLVRLHCISVFMSFLYCFEVMEAVILYTPYLQYQSSDSKCPPSSRGLVGAYGYEEVRTSELWSYIANRINRLTMISRTNILCTHNFPMSGIIWTISINPIGCDWQTLRKSPHRHWQTRHIPHMLIIWRSRKKGDNFSVCFPLTQRCHNVVGWPAAENRATKQ